MSERRDSSDLVAFRLKTSTQCAECDRKLHKGNLLRKEDEKALCMACADLDHLEFLPSGDPALTRRAGKYSKLKVVVVEWSRSRKRYERQGILVEPAAIERAEQECLADEDLRALRREREAVRRSAEDEEYLRTFAAAVGAQFPGCPPDAEAEIAEHACQKYSGRVGRSAAAKELDPEAVFLAVQAHVRHRFTGYDELLARHGNRQAARSAVRRDLDRVLESWRQPSVKQ